MTANGAKFSTDLTGRSVLVHLDAGTEHPERRPIRRQEPLLVWARERWAELASAAVSLGAAWGEAGCPRPASPKVMGGFESWEQMLRGVLQVAGVPGFLANVDARDEAVDADSAEGRELLQSLARVVGTGVEFTAAEAKDRGFEVGAQVGAEEPPGWCTKTPKALGMALSGWRDKPVGGLVLRKVQRPRTADAWRLDQCTN
jgi:hypothetical protein